MPRWLGYLLSGLVTMLLLVASLGFVYELHGRKLDHAAAVPGDMVDVGGYRMHIVCEGQGSPAVILDSGLGDGWLSWTKVQPEIAKFTRVCSYDRAGMGFSDASPKPRTSLTIAEELRTLLDRAKISPPYIVAGHSWGGLNVRMFAAIYRKDVSGMVLVDSSHPDQMHRLPPGVIAAQARAMRMFRIVPYALPFGIVRYSGVCSAESGGCEAKAFRESLEDLNTFDASGAEVRAAGTLGDLNLVVLSHDPKMAMPGISAELSAESNRVWEVLQEELRQASSQGTRQVVGGASHYIQRDRPQVVIEAIHTVWEKTR